MIKISTFLIVVSITFSRSYRLEDGSESISSINAIDDGQMIVAERQQAELVSTTEIAPSATDSTSVAVDESTVAAVAVAEGSTDVQPQEATTTVTLHDTTSGHEVTTEASTESKPGVDDEEPKPDNLTEILSTTSGDNDTVTNPEASDNLVTHNSKCDKNMENVSNPQDCRTYYKCVGEEAVLMNCPSGLYWTPSDNACTSDGFLSCGQHPDNQSQASSQPKPQMSSSQQQFLNACHQICMSNSYSKLKGEQDILNQPDYELSYYVCKCMNHAHPSA